MGSSTYLGHPGGLYPGGLNEPPASHDAAGRSFAAQIHPLDPNGEPDPDGKYVFLSVGMSNTSKEFCGLSDDGVTCNPWSFMGQAAADPSIDHTELVIVNGARSGGVAEDWESPSAEDYDRIRDDILLPLGLSEAQVQIVWVKVADFEPSIPLPAGDADAFELLSRMGNIARALEVRYPNLRLVFLSSRIYAGYATTELNPEPYAYESGFAVKWLIEAQIDQMSGGGTDPIAGDLNYETAAPWLGWGPYLWADGTNPRSDGLIWEAGDFLGDGTHPSPSGEMKVGELLLDFFSSSAMTRCWFLSGMVCGPFALYLPILVSLDSEDVTIEISLSTRKSARAIQGPSDPRSTGKRPARISAGIDGSVYRHS